MAQFESTRRGVSARAKKLQILLFGSNNGRGELNLRDVLRREHVRCRIPRNEEHTRHQLTVDCFRNESVRHPSFSDVKPFAKTYIVRAVVRETKQVSD